MDLDIPNNFNFSIINNKMNNTKILIFYNQFPNFLFSTIIAVYYKKFTSLGIRYNLTFSIINNTNILIFVPINFETDDFSAHFAVNAILDLDKRNNVIESEV